MNKRIRPFIALMAAVMCLASGIKSVIPVKAADGPCMHETTVIRTNVFKGYKDISPDGHTEVYERTYQCSKCLKQIGGTTTESFEFNHTDVRYDSLGHTAAEGVISWHAYKLFCNCGYSHQTVIPCMIKATGSHSVPF